LNFTAAYRIIALPDFTRALGANMRVTARLLACAAMAWACGAGATSADTLSNFRIGAWLAGAYSVNGTAAFDHCAGSASYKNGVYMIFAVSRTFQWSMGFENPAWALTPGQSYPIAFTVDGKSPSQATAIALTNNQVEVPLADSVPLFETFMHGEVLRVDAATQNFTFDLTNTVELLPALLQCVQNNVGVQSSSANPFASK
jgi:hypothetical protein